MFYLQKTQCPRWDSIPGPLALQTITLPTELKEISTNAVSRGCYEPTNVPITSSRESSHYTNIKTALIQWRSKSNTTNMAAAYELIFVLDYLRGYHTLQGDNSLKSVERFDHMMFICRFQASLWSKAERKAAIWLVNL
jgi:hypothetical protein